MAEPDKIHRNELPPLHKNQYSAVYEVEELKESSNLFGKESCTQISKIKMYTINARRSLEPDKKL